MTATLRSIASTVSKLRALLDDSRKDLERMQTLQTSLIESLDGFFMVKPDAAIAVAEAEAPAIELARDPLKWKEVVSLLSSGRVLGIAAQTEDALAAGSNTIRERSWIADGKAFTNWLARGVSTLSLSDEANGFFDASSTLFAKSLGIGYPGKIQHCIGSLHAHFL